MEPRGVPARILTLLWIGTLVIGCDVIPTTPRTPEPTIAGPPPTPGDIHVRAIPVIAEEPLVIRIVSGGEEARTGETFATGDLMAFDLTDFPGEHGFTVNGVACGGTFTVHPVLEVDVVMNLTQAGCHLATEGLHAPGAIDHGGD